MTGRLLWIGILAIVGLACEKQAERPDSAPAAPCHIQIEATFPTPPVSGTAHSARFPNQILDRASVHNSPTVVAGADRPTLCLPRCCEDSFPPGVASTWRTGRFLGPRPGPHPRLHVRLCIWLI